MQTDKTQEKSQKLPKLTKKQRGFVKDYLETENGTQAALKNYDIESSNPENVAKAIATENLTKPAIIAALESERKSLKQALIDKGITEDYLAKKVETLLEAKDSEGQTDFTAVDKGLKHAASFYGVETEPDKPKSGNTYNFLFSPENQADIKAIEDKIKQRLIKPHVQENQENV